MSQPLRRYGDRILMVLSAVLLSAALWADDKPCPEAAPQPAKPQYSASNLAHQQWMAGWFNELAESDDPAYLLVAGYSQLTEYPGSDSAARLLRRAAEHPNLDVAGLWALASLCGPNRGFDWCDQGRLKQQILERDSNNANAWLLQITPEIGPGDSEVWDTASNRAWLSKAAQARNFNGYYGTHATRLYDAAIDYTHRHPLPGPSPEDIAAVQDVSLRKLLEDGSLDAWQPISVLGLALLTPWTSITTPLSTVYQLCKAQWPDGSVTTRRDCQTLSKTAVLSADSWLIRQSLGLSLSRLRDESTGRDDYAAQAAIMNWEQQCTMPSWMGGLPDVLRATGPVVRQFVVEVEELGEIEANRRAAIRDYRAHPEAYDQDPSTCPQPEFPDLDWALND